MRFPAPVPYQDTANGRVGVRAAYEIDGDGYRFAVTGHDPALPLALRFETGDVDGMGEVMMTDGRYRLGRRRGDLIEPHICPYNCRVKVAGGTKDRFKVKLGIASAVGTPAVAPDVTLAVGDAFTQTIPSDSFEKRGDVFLFRGAKTGVTLIVLDYGREKILAKGKALDMGTFPDGPQPVLVSLQLGDGEASGVRVRMVRKGRTVRY